MSKNIKHFKVTLTTLGPVHIGSGKLLSKHDYFFASNTTHIFNPSKFYKKLSIEHKKLYENLLLDEDSNLNDFILDNKLTTIAMQCVSYTINDTKVKTGRNRFHNVHQFIRDGQGSPYIPGSSLKGLIRTWIIGYIVSQKPDEYIASFTLNPKERKLDSIENAMQKLEEDIFKFGSTDDKDTIMRYLSVSDSNPLATTDLMFAKKYDVFTQNDYHEDKFGNELNIYRECLKVGTKVTFRLDIDTSMLKFSVPQGKIALNATNLLAIGHNFKHYYDEHFLGNFNFGIDNRRNIIYLGGGAGFGTKTINNQLFQRKAAQENAKILYAQFPTKISDSLRNANTLRNEVKKARFEPEFMRPRGKMKKEDHRHWQVDILGVAPHTLKSAQIDGVVVEFGKCLIHIDEINEGG